MAQSLHKASEELFHLTTVLLINGMNNDKKNVCKTISIKTQENSVQKSLTDKMTTCNNG